MKTVYILGAGASKGVIPDAPLNNDLLPDSLALLDHPEPIRHRIGGTLQRDRLLHVKRFIGDFYFNNPEMDIRNRNDLPPIEDVLSQFDYAITEEQPLSDTYSVEDLKRLKDDLLYAVFSILDYRLRARISLMRQFLRKIDPEQDVIVSLNYDLIVDNAALSWGSIHYGFMPRKSYDEGGYETLVRDGSVGYGNPIYHVYKPHGSLNWLYCEKCNAVDVYVGKKALAIYDLDRPVECLTDDGPHPYTPVIITPTFLKSYKNPYIGQVWQATEEALSQADAVVFIGYSLPAADSHLRTMLRKSVYSARRSHGAPCQITVVDKPMAGDTTVYENYRRLFGGVPYHPEGFEHYVNDIMSRAG